MSHDSLLPEEARGIVERAVERCRRDPTPQCFAALGRMYHGNALSRMAAECYEIALELGADDAQTPYLLGVILFEEGRVDEAAKRLRMSIERDASYPLSHHHLGRALVHLHEVEHAVDAFARAVERDRKDPVLHTGLGKALRTAGRLDEAEQALREALRLDPDHAAAHQLLGLILHATERSSEAERHLSRLRQYNATVYNDPWMWEAYRYAASVERRIEWARSLLRAGRLESAISMLEDLARREHGGRHYGVIRALADAYLQVGDHQSAVNAYALAADLDPTDARARLSMAQILLAYGLLDDADENARLALEIDRDLTDALAVQGAVALRRGQPVEARAILERAFYDAPDSVQIAAVLGETFIEMEQFHEAVETLSSVLPASGQRAAYAEFQLATALAGLGRIDEAMDALRRAGEIEPENPHIREMMAALEGESRP